MKRTAEQKEFQTIAVISMGGPFQAKLIERCVEDMKEEFINQFGSYAFYRHDTLYGTPSECQGAERDLVFLSGVYSNKPGTKKLWADDNWKAWNVALTRAKNRMCLYHSYSMKDLKDTDTRYNILEHFLNAVKSKTVNTFHAEVSLESNPFVKGVECILSDALKHRGYRVEKKGGKIWSKALCVEDENSSKCALLHIENSGESYDEWTTVFEEGLSLQRAGRFCLRVNCLSLAFDFDSTLKEVLSFLKKYLASASPKRTITDISYANPAKKSKENETAVTGVDGSKCEILLG